MSGPQVLVPVHVEALEEGGYLAICDVIRGCHAEGDTIAEALENIEDVARIMVELCRENGALLPDELATVDPAMIGVELVSTQDIQRG